MGVAPRKPCTAPHCRNLSTGGPCASCRRKQEAARGSASERGYDAPWAAYSKRWLARFPWCGMRANGLFHGEHSRCTRDGTPTPATVTDHIRAMKAGGAKFDPQNHQSLCAGCNARKNIAFEGGFGR